MRKSVLSLSVAAALAVPGLAAAQQAAPAVPTFDKVLEASGVAVTGYIDTAYSHANRDIEGGFSTRVFDSQNNSFVLHQVGLQIAKQPKQGVGGLVNVTAGKDAGVIHSNPANESTYDLTQGYLQYATGALTVIGGKFTTLHGTEVIWSPGNANFSRSLLFGAVPFTHTGVRATYSFGDALSLIGGLNNGWDQMTDLNRDKTLELGLTSNPIKPLTIAASYYGGKEPSNVGGIATNGRRDSLNLVVGYTLIEPLTVGFEYLTVSQKEGVSDGAGGTKDGKYSGIAVYAGYAVTPKLKASVRTEWFNDKNGFHFPAASAIAGVSNIKYQELTLTAGYAIADNLDLRGEFRTDRADQAVFSDGANMSKTLSTFAVQALYKF